MPIDILVLLLLTLITAIFAQAVGASAGSPPLQAEGGGKLFDGSPGRMRSGSRINSSR